MKKQYVRVIDKNERVIPKSSIFFNATKPQVRIKPRQKR